MNITNSYIIYCHEHISTGKKYIGYTQKTMEERWDDYVYKSRSKNDDSRFAKAIRESGTNSFSHKILHVCDSLEEAKAMEIRYIKVFDTRNPKYGFNIAKGGSHNIDVESRVQNQTRAVNDLREINIDSIKFHEYIKLLRESHNISIRSFGKLIDKDPTYISKLERNEISPPSQDIINRYAEIFDVDPITLTILAGRVPEELIEIIKSDIRKFDSLIRTFRNVPGQIVDGITKKVRDGEW